MPRRRKFVNVGDWDAEATTLVEQLKEQGASVATAIQQLQTEAVVNIERMDPAMCGRYQRDYRYPYPQRNRHNFIGNKYRQRWRDDLDVWLPNYDDDDDDNNEQDQWGDYVESQDGYRRYGGYPHPHQRNSDAHYNYPEDRQRPTYPEDRQRPNYPEDRQRPNYQYDRGDYSSRGVYQNYNWQAANNRNSYRGRPRKGLSSSTAPLNNIAISTKDREDNTKESENKEAEIAKVDEKNGKDCESIPPKSPLNLDPCNNPAFVSAALNLQSIEQPNNILIPCDFTNISLDVPPATVYLDIPMEFSDGEQESTAEIITVDSINTTCSFMNLHKQDNNTGKNQGCDKTVSDSANVKCDQNLNKTENSINSIKLDKTKSACEGTKISDSANKHSGQKLKHKSRKKEDKLLEKDLGLPSKRKSIDNIDSNISKFPKVSDTKKTDSNDSNNNVNNKNTTNTEPKERPNLSKPSKKQPKILDNTQPEQNPSNSKQTHLKEVGKKSNTKKTSKSERKSSETENQQAQKKTPRKKSTNIEPRVEIPSNDTEWEAAFRDNSQNTGKVVIFRRKSVCCAAEQADALQSVEPTNVEINPAEPNKKSINDTKIQNEKLEGPVAKISSRRKSALIPREIDDWEMPYLSPQVTSDEEPKKTKAGKIRARRKTISTPSQTAYKKQNSKSVSQDLDSNELEFSDRSLRARSEGRITRSKSIEFGLNCEVLPLPRERGIHSRSRSRSRPREIVGSKKRRSVSRKLPDTEDESDTSQVSYRSSDSEKRATKKRQNKNQKPCAPKIIPIVPVTSKKLCDPRLEKYRNIPPPPKDHNLQTHDSASINQQPPNWSENPPIKENKTVRKNIFKEVSTATATQQQLNGHANPANKQKTTRKNIFKEVSNGSRKHPQKKNTSTRKNHSEIPSEPVAETTINHQQQTKSSSRPPSRENIITATNHDLPRVMSLDGSRKHPPNKESMTPRKNRPEISSESITQTTINRQQQNKSSSRPPSRENAITAANQDLPRVMLTKITKSVLERESPNKEQKTTTITEESPRRSLEERPRQRTISGDDNKSKGGATPPSSEKIKNLVTVEQFRKELLQMPERKCTDKMDILFGTYSDEDNSTKPEPMSAAEEESPKTVNNPGNCPSKGYKRKSSVKGDDLCSTPKKSALPWDHGLRAVSDLKDERKAQHRRNSAVTQEISKRTDYRRSSSMSQTCNNPPISQASSSNEINSKNLEERRSSNTPSVGRVNSNHIDPKKLSLTRRPSVQHSGASNSNSSRSDNNDPKRRPSIGNNLPSLECNDVRKAEQRRLSTTQQHSPTDNNLPGANSNNIRKAEQRRLSSTPQHSSIGNNLPSLPNNEVKRVHSRRPSTTCDNAHGEQRRPSSTGNNCPSVQHNDIRKPSTTQVIGVSVDTKNMEAKALGNTVVLKPNKPDRQASIINSLHRRLSTAEPTDGNIDKPSLKPFIDYKMKRCAQRKPSTSSELQNSHRTLDNSITLNVTNHKNEKYIVHIKDKMSKLITQRYAIEGVLPEFIQESVLQLEVEAYETKTAHKYNQAKLEKYHKVVVNEAPRINETFTAIQETPKREKEPQIVINNQEKGLEIIDLLSSDDEVEIPEKTDQIRHVEAINNLMREVFEKPPVPVVSQLPIDLQQHSYLAENSVSITPVKIPAPGRPAQACQPVPVQQLPNPAPQIQMQCSNQASRAAMIQHQNNMPELTITMNQSRNTISSSSGSVTINAPANPEICNTTRNIPPPNASASVVNPNVCGNVQPVTANTQPPRLIPIVTNDDCASALALHVFFHIALTYFLNEQHASFLRLGFIEVDVNRSLPQWIDFPKQSLTILSSTFLNYFREHQIHEFHHKTLWRCLDREINSKYTKIPVKATLYVLLQVAQSMKFICPNEFTHRFHHNLLRTFEECEGMSAGNVQQNNVAQQNRAAGVQYGNQMQGTDASYRSGVGEQHVNQPQPFSMLDQHKALLVSQINEYLRLCVYREEPAPRPHQVRRRSGGEVAHHQILQQMLTRQNPRNNEGRREGYAQMPSVNHVAPNPSNYSVALQLLNRQVSNVGRQESASTMRQHGPTTSSYRSNDLQQANLAGMDRYVPTNAPIQNAEQYRVRVRAPATLIPPTDQIQGNVQALPTQPPREEPVAPFPVVNDNYRIRLPLSRPFQPPVATNTTETSIEPAPPVPVPTPAISVPVPASAPSVSPTNPINTTTMSVPSINSMSAMVDSVSSTPLLGIDETPVKAESNTCSQNNPPSQQVEESGTNVKFESGENEVIDVDEWFLNRLQQDGDESVVSYEVKTEMITEIQRSNEENTSCGDSLPENPPTSMPEHVPPPRIASVDSGFSSPPRQIEHPEIMLDRICICSNKAELVCQCKMAIYCSRQCQVNNWPTHQEICLRTRKEYP